MKKENETKQEYYQRIYQKSKEKYLEIFIRRSPSSIVNLYNPTVQVQSAAYLSASALIREDMIKNPKLYKMEKFFEEYPHLLSAGEIGFLD